MLRLCRAILKSPSFYTMWTQVHIIIACCLLHNIIRREANDSLKGEIDIITPKVNDNPILTMETSDSWTSYQKNIANEMFSKWKAQHRIWTTITSCVRDRLLATLAF